ncbi:MAG: hypothetical protein WCG95_06880 [bacterium]
MTNVKETAIKLANLAIAEAANKDLTGEEKEHNVIEFLIKLDDNLPIADFVPNALEAQIIEIGVDKIQEYFSSLDIKALVKKCYERIKHIFKHKTQKAV